MRIYLLCTLSTIVLLKYNIIAGSDNSSPKLTKKRQKHVSLWKCNVNKKLRQSGNEYTNWKNQPMAARQMKAGCKHTCFFLCTKNFTENDRQKTFDNFWNLTDDDKIKFFLKFVKRVTVKRRRVSSEIKKYSYRFFLQVNEHIVRVCRLFFLNTLNVSKRRIYYCFENLSDKETGCPRAMKRGKNVKRVTPPEKLNEVRNHIKSFAVVDSHYCRANTQKQYLEAHLNLSKMYQLYLEDTNQPVTLAVYRNVFNNEFNISFFKPKKDLCDKCFLFNQKTAPSHEEILVYETHQQEKTACKADRDIDRSNIDPSTCILCYDLQRVIGLPKGNASSFYYKRKLNLYNLTGTAIIPHEKKITYCAIWTEAHSGRSGNDICSALIRILNELVKDFPLIKCIVLWSDSCVPQNRNKINTTAIKIFVNSNRNLERVIQKFSEPGHSNIQEVDCVHSSIDRYLKNLEIDSPLHFVRLLQNMKTKNVNLVILQMKPNDFKTYSNPAGKLDFTRVPFSRIKSILYEQAEIDDFTVQYKLSFQEINYKTCSLRKKASRNLLATPKNLFLTEIATLPARSIAKEKASDIKDLFPFLPTEDVKYLTALLKN